MVLEVLANMEYPGRFIVLGQDETGWKDIAIYGITGRSAPSRARVLIAKGNRVRTEPTDPTQLAKGNPALLIYSAIQIVNDTIIVSNGAQTNLIREKAEELFFAEPLQILVDALSEPHIIGEIDLASYEPDSNHTPRISGVLGGSYGAFAIVKQNNAKPLRQFFGFELQPGSGFFISTYTGKNVPSNALLPSFRGEPIPVVMPKGDIGSITEQIYAALGPKQGAHILSPGEDMRVGVATVAYDNQQNTREVNIKNRS